MSKSNFELRYENFLIRAEKFDADSRTVLPSKVLYEVSQYFTTKLSLCLCKYGATDADVSLWSCSPPYITLCTIHEGGPSEMALVSVEIDTASTKQ